MAFQFDAEARMKKIIHITDLHIGVPKCTQAVTAVVQRIVANGNPNEQMVLITGDMVDNAKNDTLRDAWNITLAPLSAAGFSVVHVPGNHDFGGGAALYPKLAGAFYDIVGPKPIPLLQVDQVAGVTFIGIDSQFERMHWTFGLPEQDGSIYSEDLVESDGLVGWVSKAQRQALPQVIADARARGDKIVVHLHHDPITERIAMTLGNRQMLQSLIEDKVDGLLCGHTHEWLEHCGKWGIPHFYNGGSTGGKDLDAPSPVRIIDLEAAPGNPPLI